MFYYNGKYYVTYGLHTSRTIPEDKICSNKLKEYYQKNGEMGIFTFDELEKKGLYPGGASYSVSDDILKKICEWAEKIAAYRQDLCGKPQKRGSLW